MSAEEIAVHREAVNGWKGAGKKKADKIGEQNLSSQVNIS